MFADADVHYAKIKEALASTELGDRTEAAVERWLAEEQRELMRRLIQAHLTLRGQAQARGPIVGADGLSRTHSRPEKSRALETLFGTVEVERTGHAGRGLSTLYPVDGNLNLPGPKYSHEVDRQVAKAVARLSFDAALETVGSLTGAHVPKRQAEEAVRRAARDFGEFYSGKQHDEASTSDLLILSFDQKGVVLWNEDLKEATRKAAENSRYKMDTRLSQGEKRGRKRMAAVAAVYTVAPYVRTAQEVIAGLRHVRDATPRPRPRPEGKRVWASLTRNLRDVIADAFDDACKRDPEQSKRWLVLVDGDKKLTRWVRAEARKRKLKITVVLDFIHALEYLWKAAHVFFERGTPEIEQWVLERLERMLEGHTGHVVAGMTRMATVRELSEIERKPVDKAAKYLLKRVRTGMMKYDELLAIGAPIATGVIEGACRHLICDRMDLTGARWRLAGAEAVLRMRSILSSGDFDDYWRFHEEAEFRRNHSSRYSEGTVPPVQRPSRRARRRLKVVRRVD